MRYCEPITQLIFEVFLTSNIYNYTTHLPPEILSACTKTERCLLQTSHELEKLLVEVHCWSGVMSGVSDHSTLWVKIGLYCHSVMQYSANITS
jgi:hypothetical protein